MSPCGCHSKKSIKDRESRKQQMKDGMSIARINYKYRCCKNCEHFRDKICQLSKKKNNIDFILKTENYKCPLQYF